MWLAVAISGIVFNCADGFGGGTNVTNNLIYNQCRESGDHVSVTRPHDDSCTTTVCSWVSYASLNCRWLAAVAATGRDEFLGPHSIHLRCTVRRGENVCQDVLILDL